MKKIDLFEIIGDGLIIAGGICITFIFIAIEVYGIYGQENNAIIRRFELGLGIFMVLFGLWHLLRDFKGSK